MDSTEKLSSWVLKGLLALTIIVFALFFLVGFSRPYEADPAMVDPQFTDAVLWLCFILVIVTAILTVWSLVVQFRTGGSSVKEKGLAAHSGKIAVGALVLSVIVGLIVGFANQGENLLINGKLWNNPTDIVITDTCIVSIAILLVVTLLAFVFSVVLKAKN